MIPASGIFTKLEDVRVLTIFMEETSPDICLL